MKTLLVTYEYPPDVGGVASYLGGLFGAMSDVSVMKLRQPKRPLAWLWHLPRLWLAARQADMIVVSHLLPLGTAAMLLGRPYVVIVHGLDLRLAKRKTSLAVRVLQRAKLIVANSRATASELQAFGIDPQIALLLTPCVETGLDERGSDDARALFSLTGKKVVLSVGRLVPRKGFDRLIRLLPELREACGDVVLVIVGSGSEEGRLRRDAALLHIDPYVRFVTDANKDRLASLYRAADVFTLAVRALEDDVEGFGIVFLEAALFAKPIVSTNIGGVSEAVIDGETGLLVDPSSDDDLYAALKRLLNTPEEAARFGQTGRQRVLRDFRWKDRADALLRRLV